MFNAFSFLVSAFFFRWKINFPPAQNERVSRRKQSPGLAEINSRRLLIATLYELSSWLWRDLMWLLRDSRRESNIWRPSPDHHWKRRAKFMFTMDFMFTEVIIDHRCFEAKSPFIVWGDACSIPRGRRDVYDLHRRRVFNKHFNWIRPPHRKLVFWNCKLVFQLKLSAADDEKRRTWKVDRTKTLLAHIWEITRQALR